MEKCFDNMQAAVTARARGKSTRPKLLQLHDLDLVPTSRKFLPRCTIRRQRTGTSLRPIVVLMSKVEVIESGSCLALRDDSIFVVFIK
jgi:hypothetical protein